jgi:hypothetical protein
LHARRHAEEFTPGTGRKGVRVPTQLRLSTQARPSRRIHRPKVGERTCVKPGRKLRADASSDGECPRTRSRSAPQGVFIVA